MSNFRIYPEKNSVIFEDYPTRNVGVNEVIELWYGRSGSTRLVFDWDWSTYMNRYADRLVPSVSSDTVTSLTCSLFTTYPILQKDLAVGDAEYKFDHIFGLYNFSEGDGWHHEGSEITTGFCNWNSASTILSWAAGASSNSYYSASTACTRTASKIEFRFDDERRAHYWNYGIRDYNTVVSVVQYLESYEALTTSEARKRLIYSRHTNTVFLPYMEIYFDDHVSEDRSNVIADLSTGANLYIVFVDNGILTDGVIPNSVSFGDVYESTDIERVTRGIYRYTGSTPTSGDYQDTWNVTYPDGSTGTVSQNFTCVISSQSSRWSTSRTDFSSPSEYWIYSESLLESYVRGDIAFVPIRFKEEYTTGLTVHKSAQYRIYMEDSDGSPLLVMTDWTSLSYLSETNFIMIDTSWYIPDQTYAIEVRYSFGGSLRTAKLSRKFYVRD